MAAALAAGGLANVVHADFVPPATWAVGDVGSTFQAWDAFGSTLGPNAPDAGVFNPNDDPSNPLDLNAYDGNFPASGSFLVGGNIYSPMGVVAPAADVPGYGSFSGGDFTTVIVNLTTRGTGPDFDTLQLTADGQAVPLTSGPVLVGSVPLGGAFGGDENDYWLQFNFEGSFEALNLSFQAAGGSMSFAALRIDTLTGAAPVIESAPAAVPEPGALALVATFVPALRRRR